MNWMQLYEIVACAVLAGACILFNCSMRGQWRVTRGAVMLLCASAIVRGSCLIAKYTSLANMAGAISAAADANIPLMTAAVLVSIVVHQVRARNMIGVK